MIELRHADASVPPGSDLLAAMVAEVVELYGPGFLPSWPSADPDEVRPPHGAFLLLYDDGEPVACGAVKRLDERTAEIKRMYVAPAARSRGHARRLLVGLEDAARELGYGRVRLDTGPKQPHALALYRSAGFHEIPAYNGNLAAEHWLEKELRAEAH